MRTSIKKLMMVVVLICAVLVVNQSHAFAATDPYLTGYKWTKSNLTYYIDRTPTSSNLSVYIPLLVQAIEGAEFMWNVYLNDYGTGLSFTQVTTQSNADIIIKFGNPGVGVDAKVVATETIGNTYKKVTMTVKDYNIINYTGNRIVNIFQHEFGHTIGLRDLGEDLGIYSIMVNELDSIYHVNYPTYDFDRINLLKMYP